MKEKHNKHKILGKSEENIMFVRSVKIKLICMQ